MLEATDIQRYSRQLILKGWSSALQSQLATTRVCLPSTEFAAATYLLAAGVRKIALLAGTARAQSIINLLKNLDPLAEIELIADSNAKLDLYDFSIRPTASTVEVWRKSKKISDIIVPYARHLPRNLHSGPAAALAIINALRS